MAYFERDTAWKSIFYSRGMALAVLVLCALVGYGAARIAGKSIGAAKERRLAEHEAAELSAKQADLEKKLAALGTPEGREAVLREQFPVVREGEGVVMITEGGGSGTAAVGTAVPSEENGGVWSFFKNLFK